MGFYSQSGTMLKIIFLQPVGFGGPPTAPQHLGFAGTTGLFWQQGGALESNCWSLCSGLVITHHRLKGSALLSWQL